MNSVQLMLAEAHEADLADVTDSDCWRVCGDFYRSLRASVTGDHPMAFWWGWPGWWRSKNEFNGAPRPTRPQTNEQEQDQ